uniref:Secreted protein n=1 Tax=Trichogramma kaykai TaxID=54128 RepID=A0ABD2VTR6_9HYME
MARSSKNCSLLPLAFSFYVQIVSSSKHAHNVQKNSGKSRWKDIAFDEPFKIPQHFFYICVCAYVRRRAGNTRKSSQNFKSVKFQS